MRYASVAIDMLATPASHARWAELVADQIADDADRIEQAVVAACGDTTEEAKTLRRAYGALRAALEQHAARARLLGDHWHLVDLADGPRLDAAADAWTTAVYACEQTIRDRLTP